MSRFRKFADRNTTLVCQAQFTLAGLSAGSNFRNESSLRQRIDCRRQRFFLRLYPACTPHLVEQSALRGLECQMH